MKNLDNYKIENKRVLLRADLNVPVVDNIISDTSRISAVKSSIKKLILNKNKIFIISHFGRPKGKIVEKYSLNFIISSLKEILEIKNIHFLKKLDEKMIKNKFDHMQSGEVCLVENIRFQKCEEKNDIKFAENISKLFDVYVNDAFSASHRKHTSITAFAKFIPAVAGDHLIQEIKNINLFIQNATKPNMAILGGSKISTKIHVLNNLVEHFSSIAIGGAMANTFLLANKIRVGKSLVEENLVSVAKKIQMKAKNFNCKLLIPVDVICGKNIKDKNPVYYSINKIPSDLMILDIGKISTKLINEEILNSKMLLWNGPVGAFENQPYNKATNEIAKTIKLNAKKYNIKALAGGGDTISAIKDTNSQDGFDYISNAGGAFLEWLEGNQSPGIIALKENSFI